MSNACRNDTCQAHYEAVSDVFKGKFLESWSLLSTIRKPIIAAVSGYAVSPDVLFCSNAAFALPNLLGAYAQVVFDAFRSIRHALVDSPFL